MTPQPKASPIYAIIPAAGRSQRMGGAPKPLLRLGQRTMLECVVEPLAAAGLAGIAVVTTPAIAAALPAALRERVELVVPPDRPREMIDSVRLGLAHWSQRGVLTEGRATLDEVHATLTEASDARAADGDARANGGDVPAPGCGALVASGGPHAGGCGVLVCPADQPDIAVKDIRACAAAFAADPTRIVVATLAGRRGHPLIFPAALADFVRSAACDAGLSALPRAHAGRVTLVPCTSRGVIRDVDSPADVPDEQADPGA